MGALEGNLSRNSDGSTFGASAVGWSPYDDHLEQFYFPWIVKVKVMTLEDVRAKYQQPTPQTFGDPAYDDEHYLKSRGEW